MDCFSPNKKACRHLRRQALIGAEGSAAITLRNAYQN